MSAPYKRAKLEPQLTLSHSELLRFSVDEKSRSQQVLRSSFLLRMNSCESEITVENESLEVPLKRKREEKEGKCGEIDGKDVESEGEYEEEFAPVGILLINDAGDQFYSMQSYSRSSTFYILLRSGRCGLPGLRAIKGPYRNVAGLNLELASLRQAKLEAGYVDTRYRGWWKGPVQTRSQDRKVEALSRLLTSEQVRKFALKEVGYGVKRKKFEELKEEEIEQGYKTLKELEVAIRNNEYEEIRRLTEVFYTIIPHKQAYDQDGDTQIDHTGKLRTQTAFLSTLHSLKHTASPTHIADKLQRLDKGSQLYEDLTAAFSSTHEKSLMYAAQVEEIYAIREELPMQTEELEGLWYGTKISNWGRTLESGVQTYGNAPKTAFESGAGAYLSDVAARATANCCPTRTNSIGFVALCGVSLPNSPQLQSPHSPGRFQPSQSRLIEALRVPIGPVYPSGPFDSQLLFNQYVFSDASQVQVKYLFQLRFSFP